MDIQKRKYEQFKIELQMESKWYTMNVQNDEEF